MPVDCLSCTKYHFSEFDLFSIHSSYWIQGPKFGLVMKHDCLVIKNTRPRVKINTKLT